MASTMVIGSGVVGKATGIGLSRRNNEVTFVDIDLETCNELSLQGYKAVLPEAVDVTDIDVIFMSVTALTGETGIDLEHMLAATRNLGDKLSTISDDHYPVVVFRCTMPPGTTRGTLIPLLEEHSGKRVEHDFGVIYMPEYLRASTAEADFFKPRAITLASSSEHDRAFEIVHKLFLPFETPIHQLTYEEAEFQKYVHNLFNACKISFFNEMRQVAHHLGIDPEESFQITTLTAESMWDGMYGTKDYGAYAGACLPKDVAAWLFWTDDFGEPSPLMRAVQQVNRQCGGQ
jgi:UDPglucose 6-dehydrogenase